MITSIRTATAEEWDGIVATDPQAVCFQAREWFDIWSAYGGFVSDTRLITLDTGKQVLLPLAYLKLLGGLIKVYFLSPKGLGGFVSATALDAAEARALFPLLRQCRFFYGAVNPYDGSTNAFPHFNREDFTQVLDLTPGFDALVKTWSAGHRRAIDKGLKAGVTVAAGATVEDWRDYFAIYEETLARWGKSAVSRYGWKLFDILRMQNPKRIRLWMARCDGQPVAGAICLYHHRRVVYWHGAARLKDHRRLNAAHVLHQHIIQDAIGRGFLLYDFLPSSGLPGVVDFKRRFAAEEVRVNIYLTPAMEWLSRWRKRLRHQALYQATMRDTGFA